ncbi:unnamed protein product [Darwinula stevensoni]|uniref:Septin-type G domain-containing protein n=1 Tax=Darwinula stevensoni TaxID=69355 RepID=A0A7R9A9R2_9CRUS|nr:unnamed protein product [Darwinula stevensoni]CAG0897640.1 unnamed protein product [Darwinula stevensoni]
MMNSLSDIPDCRRTLHLLRVYPQSSLRQKPSILGQPHRRYVEEQKDASKEEEVDDFPMERKLSEDIGVLHLEKEKMEQGSDDLEKSEEIQPNSEHHPPSAGSFLPSERNLQLPSSNHPQEQPMPQLISQHPETVSSDSHIESTSEEEKQIHQEGITSYPAGSFGPHMPLPLNFNSYLMHYPQNSLMPQFYPGLPLRMPSAEFQPDLHVKMPIAPDLHQGYAIGQETRTLGPLQFWKYGFIGNQQVPSTGPIDPISDNMPDNEGREKMELSLAQKMKETSRNIDGFIHQLPMRETLRDDNHRLAKYEIGEEGPTYESGRVLMLIGATGTGKTTLINAMVNYVYGVKWEDNFRFKIILDEGGKKSQAHSQTRSISAYVLHKQEGFAIPYTLTVVDTPGFGDTAGIKADEDLRIQIKNFFSSGGTIGMDQLHGIGFVVQASLARLTPTQKYIFNSILAVFGKDVEKSIYVLTTFSDSEKAPVLAAIQEASIPYREHYKFSNSAFFVNPSDDSDSKILNTFFWDLGMKSFQNFLLSFVESDPVSLTMTKEVLEERERLEAALAAILPQIRIAKGNSLTAKELLEELIKDFNQERVKVLELTREAHKCKQKLEEIALNPNPLGITDYIDLLIQRETQEGKPGFLQRIKYLEDAKEKAELAKKLKDGFDPFQVYRKEFEEKGIDISAFNPNPDQDRSIISRLKGVFKGVKDKFAFVEHDLLRMDNEGYDKGNVKSLFYRPLRESAAPVQSSSSIFKKEVTRLE